MICSWCNTNGEEAAARHEGPHSTWCPSFREWQRGGTEHCIRAAIVMPSGEIIEGRRHFNCLDTVRDRGDDRMDICRATQGFMTNTGRFVDRFVGKELQIAAGIPSAFTADGSYGSDELYSEDLY